MSDVQVLMATVGENIGALLHGSEREAEEALDRVLEVVDDGPSFGALCGMLAEVGGDALREMRAQMPPGPARMAEFAMFPMSESVPQHARVSRQLITASANGDSALVRSLLVAVLSWPTDPMFLLLGNLAGTARGLHLSVCSDPTSDVEKGAGA